MICKLRAQRKKLKGSVFFSAANIITSTSVKVCALLKISYTIKLNITKSVQRGKREKRLKRNGNAYHSLNLLKNKTKKNYKRLTSMLECLKPKFSQTFIFIC